MGRMLTEDVPSKESLPKMCRDWHISQVTPNTAFENLKAGLLKNFPEGSQFITHGNNLFLLTEECPATKDIPVSGFCVRTEPFDPSRKPGIFTPSQK